MQNCFLRSWHLGEHLSAGHDENQWSKIKITVAWVSTISDFDVGDGGWARASLFKSTTSRPRFENYCLICKNLLFLLQGASMTIIHTSSRCIWLTNRNLISMKICDNPSTKISGKL